MRKNSNPPAEVNTPYCNAPDQTTFSQQDILFPREITSADARHLPTFKNWPEDQIDELIRTVKSFCNVAYRAWGKKRKRANESSVNLLTGPAPNAHP